MIVGENPLEVERIWHRLFQGWRHPKMDDLMAISKVDVAIWDLLGKVLSSRSGGYWAARETGSSLWRRGHVYGDKGIAELVAEMLDFTFTASTRSK